MLAESYAKAINEGGVPCIGSAVELMQIRECEKAIVMAIEVYCRVSTLQTHIHQADMIFVIKTIHKFWDYIHVVYKVKQFCRFSS